MAEYTISDFRRDTREGPYSFPGGYPKYFTSSDGSAFSYEGAKARRRDILESIRDCSNDGFRVNGCGINWESDLYCDLTGKPIPSAYGSDE